MKNKIFKKGSIIATTLILGMIGLSTFGSYLNNNDSISNELLSTKEVSTDYNTQLPPGYTIKQFVHASEAKFAVINDGENDHLYAWGGDSHGWLGAGIENMGEHWTAIFPTEIDFGWGTEDWEIVDVEVSYEHAAAVLNDGERDHIFTWGSNIYGEAGFEVDTSGTADSWHDNSTIYTPKEVYLGEGTEDWSVEQISVGYQSTMAILNDGTRDHVYMWGYAYGEYGDLWNNITELPVVEGSEDWEVEQISTTEAGAMILYDTGTEEKLYTWGLSNQAIIPGAFDDFSLMDTPKLAYFGPGTEDWEIEKISKSTMLKNWAVLNDGTNDHVFVWGSTIPTLQEIDFGEEAEGWEVQEVSVGRGLTSSAVLNDGKRDHLFMWGDGYYWGEDEINSDSPIEISFGEGTEDWNIEYIGNSDYDQSAILNDGKEQHLFMWGKNHYSQTSHEIADDEIMPYPIEFYSTSSSTNFPWGFFILMLLITLIILILVFKELSFIKKQKNN